MPAGTAFADRGGVGSGGARRVKWKTFPVRATRFAKPGAGHKATSSLSTYGCRDGAVNNYHPTYSKGGFPYTSPVGRFTANGYRLDEHGWETRSQWCWDDYGAYTGGMDPRGAASGSGRVLRGGYWY